MALNLEQHRGRWVVVAQDEVLVEADSLADLMKKAAVAGVQEGTMRRIPALHEPAFIGLA